MFKFHLRCKSCCQRELFKGEKEKIDSLEKLSDYSEKEIMQLHGFGKNTMQKLKVYMNENHVSFKNN